MVEGVDAGVVLDQGGDLLLVGFKDGAADFFEVAGDDWF